MIDDVDFFVEVARVGSADYVVRVTGPISVRNAARLQEALLDALAASPSRLSVGLAAVGTIDASGLDVLVAAYRRATAAGTRLHFEGAGSDLAHVLEQNGLPTTAEPTLDLTAGFATEPSPPTLALTIDPERLGLR
jgi:anti-sigma B factor antagonist